MVHQCNAESSWDDVVRTHAARVYRYAYRLTNNHHDAEDLAQEVFLRVFRSLSKYRIGTFEGWLYRITTNLFLDALRRHNNIHLVPITDNLPLTTGQDPYQDYAAHTFDPDIRAALAVLPSGQLATLVLHDVDGLNYQEIAQLLNIRPGTVASRLHRARTHLRTTLAHRSHSRHRASTAAP